MIQLYKKQSKNYKNKIKYLNDKIIKLIIYIKRTFQNILYIYFFIFLSINLYIFF
jgi:hypothetical protein